MYQQYCGRLTIRMGLLVFTTYLLIFQGSVLDFTSQFGPSHGITFINLLWIYFMAELIADFFPRHYISIGNEKQFMREFRPTKKDRSVLTDTIKEADRSAFWVFVVWTIPNLAIGFLYHQGIFVTKQILLWLCVFYFAADLICVLFFCPFQYFIMKNRCCVTCRIFKWDSLMTFTPLFFVSGTFSASLLLVSAILGFLWEYRLKKYPERFFEQTNQALKCSQCTTYMCRTKFQKFRPKKLKKN